MALQFHFVFTRESKAKMSLPTSSALRTASCVVSKCTYEYCHWKIVAHAINTLLNVVSHQINCWDPNLLPVDRMDAKNAQHSNLFCVYRIREGVHGMPELQYLIFPPAHLTFCKVRRIFARRNLQIQLLNIFDHIWLMVTRFCVGLEHSNLLL